MCVILQKLSGFITGRLKLFHNVLNEPSASQMMLAMKLLSPGTVPQITAYLLALSVGELWPEPLRVAAGDHTGWELGQWGGGSGCSYRSLNLRHISRHM